MSLTAVNPHPGNDPVVSIMLTGGRVTSSFREAVFAAAARSNASINELALSALAEKLAGEGYRFGGVFKKGDLSRLKLSPSNAVTHLR